MVWMRDYGYYNGEQLDNSPFTGLSTVEETFKSIYKL